MTSTGERLTALTIAVGATIGSAGVAWADGPTRAYPGDLSGVYTYQSSNGRVNTWNVTSCGPGCADVTITPVSDTRVAPHSGRATLNNGRWTMTVQSAQAVRCKPPNDNTTLPGTAAFSFDNATLSGYAVNTQTVPGCGDPAGATYHGDFTLTRVA
jgi:hypothetical protein